MGRLHRDVVTAVKGIQTVAVENTAWYDLTGRRVAQPTKGLYIHNGKKILVK